MSTSPQPTDIENEYDEEEDEEPIDLTQQLIQMADKARKRFTDAERQLRDIGQGAKRQGRPGRPGTRISTLLMFMTLRRISER